MAHIKGPQIFVAHFDYVWDVMMTKFLGLVSEVMAAEVISEKKGHCLPSAEDGQSIVKIRVDLQRKIRSLHFQFIGAGLYGSSYALLLINLIWLANPLFKYANICLPTNLCAVAHQLRTSVLDIVAMQINNYLNNNNNFIWNQLTSFYLH